MAGVLLYLPGPIEGTDVASHNVNLETRSLPEECRYPIKKLHCVAIYYERINGYFLDSLSTGICRRNVCLPVLSVFPLSA